MIMSLTHHGTDATDESELIRLCLAGQAEAFAVFVRRHQAAVRWALARYVREPATVDDLAQEVFLQAHQGLTEFRGSASPRAWLLGIARNLAKQHLRTESRRKAREQGPLAVKIAQWRLDRLERTPEDLAEQESLFSALWECLGNLAPGTRQAVEDHYFAGRTLESIARQQGRSAGAVRMMLLRVRQALAECIRQKVE